MTDSNTDHHLAGSHDFPSRTSSDEKSDTPRRTNPKGPTEAEWLEEQRQSCDI
jgi:hypothetical protein